MKKPKLEVGILTVEQKAGLRLKRQLARFDDLLAYWVAARGEVSFRRGDGRGKTPTAGGVLVGRYTKGHVADFLDDLTEMNLLHA